MFSPPIAHLLLLLIVGLSVLLMLARPRGLPEILWAGSGCVLLLVLRLVPLRLAGRAVAQGTDVYLFLIGMMLLSELAREQGVFDWLASHAVASARGSSVKLFALIYGTGVIVTAFLSNDATAVVLTPAVLSAVRKAGGEARPHLFACAMVANAASFFLPISNPANLVVFAGAMPPLAHWLAAFALPAFVSTAVTYLVLRWWFRKTLCEPVQSDVPKQPLASGGHMVLWGLGSVVAVLLVSSALRWNLGLPTCLAAAIVTTFVCWRARMHPLPLLRAVSWQTIGLVAALFVLVRAAETAGALSVAAKLLQNAAQLPRTEGAMLVSLAVGVANNLVNNLPLGLLAGSAVHTTHTHGLLANAVLLGVDLGPNLSVTGSLATILWLLALRREKFDISAGEFLRLGCVAMPVALIAATAVLLLFKQ